MNKKQDELVLINADAGNEMGYQSAVDAGANPNAGASNGLEDLDSSVRSAYSLAKQNRDVGMMRVIATNAIAGPQMQLSDMEDQLLDAAQRGNPQEISAALRGVRNPQLLDVARDVAQVSGHVMAFHRAEAGGQPDIMTQSRFEAFAGAMSAAAIFLRRPENAGKDIPQDKRDTFAKSAQLAQFSIAQMLRDQLKEQQQGRTRTRRVRTGSGDAA